MEPLQILSHIWERSEGAFVFLPEKDPATGQWIETCYAVEDVNHFDVMDWGLKHDLFFSPVRYTGRERIVEQQGNIGILYADLDDKYDQERLAKYEPSFLWETSPGSFQAVWFLSHPIPPEQAIELNRKLSLYVGADHASWIPTKLLRIPETPNWKRGGVQGTLVSYDLSIQYIPEDLQKFLDPLVPEKAPVVSDGVPEVPTEEEWKATLSEIWPKLDTPTKKLLTREYVEDRSLFLARVAKRMATISIPPEVTFRVLSRHRANKFTARPDTLWTSVVLTAYN